MVHRVAAGVLRRRGATIGRAATGTHQAELKPEEILDTGEERPCLLHRIINLPFILIGPVLALVHSSMTMAPSV